METTNGQRRWRVVLEQDPETGEWAAWCPELPGCASAGDTEEEAIENIREAIALYLQPDEIPFAPNAILRLLEHPVQLCAASKSPTMSGKQAKCQQVCLKQANFVALKAPKVLTIQRQQLCYPVPAHIGDDAGVVGALADNLIRDAQLPPFVNDARGVFAKDEVSTNLLQSLICLLWSSTETVCFNRARQHRP
jgi:predicted RNase H-like HicB family nuclease